MAESKRGTYDRVRAYCSRCQHVQLFKRSEPEHRWHFLISILTGGLWVISWISVAVMAWWEPWRCQRCGWHLPHSSKGMRRSGVRSASNSVDTGRLFELPSDTRQSRSDGTAP